MFEKVLGFLFAGDEVDAVAVIFTPPLVYRRTDEVAVAIVAAVDRAPLPQTPARSTSALRCQAGGGQPARGRRERTRAVLRSARFPVPSYTYPETAVRALAHAMRYAAGAPARTGHCPPWPTST